MGSCRLPGVKAFKQHTLGRASAEHLPLNDLTLKTTVMVSPIRACRMGPRMPCWAGAPRFAA